MRRTAYFLTPLLAIVLILAPIASTQQQLPLPSGMSAPGESRPSPDPTRLTTEQLIRELNSLREILTARMDAADKERVSILLRMEKFDELIEKRVRSLQALHEERFLGISLQFKERDTRTEQKDFANATSLQAAFQAAEKGVVTAFQAARDMALVQQTSASLAIAKSEAATAKQLDQLATLFDTNIKALRGQFDDMKSVVSSLQNASIGSKEYRETSQASTGAIVGIIGAIIAALSLIGFVVVNALKQHKP